MLRDYSDKRGNYELWLKTYTVDGDADKCVFMCVFLVLIGRDALAQKRYIGYI